MATTRTGVSRMIVTALLLSLGVVASPWSAAGETRSAPPAERQGQAPALIGWGANPGARHDVPRRLERARITRLAAGVSHNLAVTRNGALVAWGVNHQGQLDVPAALDGKRVTRVAAGRSHSLAVTGRGAVVAWGDDRRGQTDVPDELANGGVVQVAAGFEHSLALTETGGVVAWGANGAGQSNVPAELDGVRVTRIDAGLRHSLALTSDGTVVGWGSNDYGQSDVPDSLAGVRVTQIAAGGRHNLALTEDGAVVGWGSNRRGQSSVPRSLEDVAVRQLAAGDVHSLVLTRSGALRMWGSAARGRTALPSVLRGRRILRVVAGSGHNLVLARYRGPDVQIRGNRSRDLQDESSAGRYVGNNFFLTRGRPADIGGSWVADVWSRRSHVFRVRVYNDHARPRTLRVRGSVAWVSSPGHPRPDPSLVRFYDRRIDVTRALLSPRGVTVRLRADEYREFRMWVALVPRFSLVKQTSARLSATWIGHPRRTDQVKGTVSFID